MSDIELAKKLDRSFRATKFRRGKLGIKRREFGKFHNIEEVTKLFENRNYQLIDKEYISNSTKMEYICNKHKENGIQKITLSHFLCGEGCYFCGREKTTNSRRNSVDIFKDYCSKHNMQFVDVKYVDNRSYMLYICNKHKDCGIQEKSLTSMLKETGCQHCKNSSGENIVKDILIKNNIQFIKEKRFEKCRFKNTLPFDFYLPEYNICIEYDGIQHYKPVDFANKGEEWATNVFEKVKIKDNIKTLYCNDNNINLIRIPYYENNIESFLMGKIKLRKIS